MPNKPLHPCSYPGCPKLTLARFCEEHTTAENRRYNRYERDPASKKRYGYRWQKIRARFLSAHPLCAECQREGRMSVAAEVHHIIPLSNGGTHAESNLEGLCRSHHSSLHLRERSRKRNVHTPKR